MKRFSYYLHHAPSRDFTWPLFAKCIRLTLMLKLFVPIFWLLMMPGFLNNLGAQPSPDTSQIVRLKWINFSPYTKLGQNPNILSVIPEAQIIALLDSLKPWVEGIRIFGTQYGLENIPKLAKERGFKVIVGIWIGKDTLANAAQITNGIAIANAGYADRLIVGSEALLRNEFMDSTSAKLIHYIKEVKLACPSIPVSCADVYQELIAHPEVVAVCDFVSPNIYPFWEGIPVACSMQRFNQSYLSLLSIFAGKEIFISESGWRTCGQANGGSSQPSLESAIRYNRELLGWSKAFGIDVNLFSAFDEPWKEPNDGCWGIFNKDGTLKPGMDTLFKPFTTIDSTWLCKVPQSNGTDTLVIDFIPPAGSGAFLKGHVNHLVSCNFNISIWIKVNGGWWIKPTFAQPTVPILCDGSWTADYVTGGSDASATDICVFVVPAGFDTPPPPNCGGCASIPVIMYQNAIASNCIHRYVLSPVTISANPETICWGGSTTITATGGTSYLWSNGETTPSIQVAPTYNTNYTVTITDGMGGGAIATTSIIVINPQISTFATPFSVCPGEPSTLTATGGNSYVWSTGETINPIVVMPTTTTTYSVTATDANGCTKTSSVKLYVNTVNGSIYVNGNHTSICKGESIRLYGQGGSYYLWNTQETTSSILVSPDSTTTYHVTVTALSTNCKDTAEVTLVVFNPPIATVSTNLSTICRYDTATLTAGGGIAYKWNTGDTTKIIRVTPTSTRTYYVTVTNAEGCTDIATVTVTVIPSPTAYQVTGGGAYCAGGPGIVVGMADSQNGTKYQLKRGGTDAGVPILGTGVAVSFGNQTEEGIYKVVATNITSGCTNVMTDSAIVTMNPSPVVTVTPDGPTIFCSGDSVILDAGLNFASYLWSSGAITQKIQVSASGIYNVTVTSGAACTGAGTTDIIVTVNPNPVVKITADGPTTFCFGDSVTLDAGMGFDSYSWSLGLNTAAIVVSPDSSLIYYVTVTNSFGCPDTAMQEVIVNPLPIVTLTGLDSSYTDQDTAVALGGIPLNGSFYGTGVSSNTFNPMLSGVGHHTIYYLFKDLNGCYGIDSMIVTVCAVPIAGFNFHQDELFVDFQNTSTLTDSIAWDFGDGVVSNDVNPNHTYDTNGIYNVCLIVQNDCGTDTLCSTVLAVVGTNSPQKPEWVPVVFPNPSAGKVNIDWRNSGTQKAMLIIHDQFGRQIQQFEKGLERQTVWDGTDKNGNPINPGVYLFKFSLGRVIWFEKVLITHI